VIRDGNSNPIDSDYDTLGRLVRQTFVDGVKSFVYNDQTGYVSETIDANGNRTIYVRDPMNRIIETRHIGNADTPTFRSTTTYDAHGNAISQTDRDQVITERYYDVLDRPSRVTVDVNDLARSTRYGYDLSALTPNYSVQSDGGDVFITKHPNELYTVSVYNQWNELVANYDQLGRRTQFIRDKAGRVTTVIPPHGLAINKTLDQRGRVIVETGPLPDQRTTTTYDNADRILQTAVANTTGDQVTKYRYNLYDAVAEVINAENHVTRYEYDNAGNRTAEKLAAGSPLEFSTEWTYDGRNRPITETRGASAASVYTYYPEGQIQKVTDPNGHTHEYLLDTMNRQIRILDPEGGETMMAYSGEGNLVSLADARGPQFETVYVYDGLRQLLSETNPAGETTSYDYDKAGRQIAVADPRATGGVGSPKFVRRSEYDAVGRLIATIDAEGNRVEYEYDNQWDTIKTVRIPAPNADGSGFVETRHVYSANRRTVTVTTPTGTGPEVARRMTFDTLGNLLQTEIVGTNVVTKTVYDKLNRAVQTIEAPNSPDAATSEIRYDARGKTEKRIDPLGVETRYVYDDRLYLSETIDGFGTPDQISVLSVFDDVGNLISLSDPRDPSLLTTFKYDGLNRRYETNRPYGPFGQSLLATETITYDEIGNVLTESDPRNPAWLTRYDYDAAGRVTRKIDALNFQWTFGYDAAGNQTSVSDPVGNTRTIHYDANNRFIGESNPLGHTSCIVYDGAGNVIAEVAANAGLTSCEDVPFGTTHTTRHIYDNANRRIEKIDAEGFSFKYVYDAASRVIELIDPRSESGGGDFFTRFAYDGRSNLIRTEQTAGLDGDDEILVSRKTYDLRDSVLVATDPRGVQTRYTYDDLGRTKTMTQQITVPGLNLIAPDETTQYVYDAAGNIIEVIDPRGSFFNQIRTYDASGNLESSTQNTGTPEHPGPSATWLYTYDANGRLTLTQDPRGAYFTTVSTFDAVGRRESTSRPRGLPSEPLAPAVEQFVYDASGRLIVKQGPLRDEAGELVESTFVYDNAGRQIKVTNAAGHVNEYVYDANGNVIREIYRGSDPSGIATPDREVRHVYDELDRVITTTDTLGRDILTEYDEVGNLIGITGPHLASDGTPATLTKVFDGANRLRSQTDQENHTWGFQYDGASHLIAQSDPRGAFYTIETTFDGAGRVRSISQPTGTAQNPGAPAIHRFEYERSGNIVRHIDPRGDDYRTTTVHDVIGSVALVEHPYGRSAGDLTTVTERWVYDVAGHLEKMIDPRGEAFAREFSFDAAGNLLVQRIPAGTESAPRQLVQSFTYDEVGNRLTHTDWGGVDYVTTFTYDKLGRATSITDAVGDSITWKIDRFGNAVETTDKFGSSFSTYDAADRPLVETDPLGHEVRFEYTTDALGEVTRRTDQRGHTTLIRYDGLGRVIRETDPLGSTLAFGYDPAGNPISLRDARGTLHLTGFDARNLPITQTVAVGTEEAATTNYEYDLLGRRTLETDPRDPSGQFYATGMQYDALSRLIRTTRSTATPGGTSPIVSTPGFSGVLVEEWYYDVIGNTIRTVPTGGPDYAIETEFDRASRPIRTTVPSGTSATPRSSVYQYTYNDAGEMVEMVDPNGAIQRWTYDTVGRETSHTILGSGGRADLVKTYDYVSGHSGQRMIITDALGTVAETHHYDPLGRVTRSEYRGQPDRIRTFDPAGNLASETQGRWTQSYTYDARNHRASMTDGEGKTTTYQFDANGNVVSFIEPGETVPTIYVYDGLNRTRRVTDPEGNSTSTDYDLAGNLIRLTDGGGTSTSYVYDGADRLIAETDPLGTIVHVYDAHGSRIETTDRNGRVRRFLVDHQGRLRTEQWIDQQGGVVHELHHEIDPDGRLTSATDGGNRIEFDLTPDAADHLRSQTLSFSSGHQVIVSRDFDALGRTVNSQVAILGAAEPFLSTSISRNSSTDRLTRLDLSGSFAPSISVELDYVVDLPNSIAALRYHDAADSLIVTSDYTYDRRALVTQIQHRGSSGIYDTFASSYFDDGNVRTDADVRGETAYLYDRANRLAAVNRPGDDDQLFNYDEAGNRTDSGITVGIANQIETDGERTFTYDNEGNLIRVVDSVSGVTQEFEWDYRNRLTRILASNTGGDVLWEQVNGFDAFDRRIHLVLREAPQPGQSLVTIDDRWFVYDGRQLIAELTFNASGDIEPDQVYLVNPETSVVLAQATGSDYQFLLHDRQNSTRLIVDSAGVLATRLHYGAYGELIATTDPAVTSRFLYSGGQFDAATGLYYLMARFYDPALGRFLSKDPSGFVGNDANLYRYAGGNPTNFRDPSGLARINVGGISSQTQRAASYSSGTPAGFRGQLNTLSLETGLSFGAAGIASSVGRFSNEVTSSIDAAASSAFRAVAPTVGHYAALLVGRVDVALQGGDPDNQAAAIAAAQHRFNQLGEWAQQVVSGSDEILKSISARGRRNDLHTQQAFRNGDYHIGFANYFVHLALVGEAAIISIVQGLAETTALGVDVTNIGLAIGGHKSDREQRQNYSQITKAVEVLGATRTAGLAIEGILAMPGQLTSGDPAQQGQVLGFILEAATPLALSADLRLFSKSVRSGGRSLHIRLPDAPKVSGAVDVDPRRLKNLPTEAELTRRLGSMPEHLDYPTLKKRFQDQPDVNFDQIETRVESFFRNPENRARLDGLSRDEVNRLKDISKTIELSRELREPPKHGAKEGFTVGKPNASPIEHYIFDQTEGWAHRIRQMRDPKFNAETARVQADVSSLVKRATENLSPSQRAMANKLVELMGDTGRIGLPNVWRRLSEVIGEQIDIAGGPGLQGNLSNKLSKLNAEQAAKVISRVDEIWTRDPIMTEISAQFARDSAFAKSHGIAGIFERGSFGSSVDQFLFRAKRVHGIASGRDNAFDLLNGKNWDYAWRTVADLFKTPLGSGSDFDFNIVTLNRQLFEKLHAKVDNIVGKEFVDAFFDFSVDQLQKRIQKSAGNEAHLRELHDRLDTFLSMDAQGKRYDLVELYKQDKAEFIKIDSARALIANPIAKGAHGYLVPYQDYLLGPTAALPDFDFPPSVFTESQRLRKLYGNPPQDLWGNTLARVNAESTIFGTDGAFTILNESFHVPASLLRASGIYGPVRWGESAQVVGPPRVDETADSADESIDPSDCQLQPTTESIVLCGAFAFDAWSDELNFVPAVAIAYEVLDLPHGILGMTTIVDRDTFGRPVAATIQIDVDASGFGWGAEGYDLATTLLHEIGHAIGFDRGVPAFAAAQVTAPGGWTMQLGDLTAYFEPGGSELDSVHHPDAVMAGQLNRQVRKSLTPFDVLPVLQAWNTTLDYSGAFTHSGSLPLGAGGNSQFVLFAANVAEAILDGPPVGIGNANFAVTDPAGTDFSWKMIGDIQMADGVATIREDVGMISDLSQTFVIPDGVNTITFTLGGISLDVGGGNHPPEAFEVALLNATLTTSLLGPMSDLGGGDAILNIQADGSVYFADGVRVSGVSQSGDKVASLSEPIDVTVSLPSSIGGTTSTLYFDLIGFGTDDSRVDVSGVRLHTRGSTWQNPSNRFDVSGNNGVTAADVLTIINELHRAAVHDRATGELVAITDEVGPPPFYDVNGDGRVTAIDAIQVLNRLYLEGLGSGGELPDSWHNRDWPADVNADGQLTAADAFAVINELRNPRVHDPNTGALPPITSSVRPQPYFDVDGDGRLTVVDALRIINELSRPRQGEPEANDRALLELLDAN